MGLNSPQPRPPRSVGDLTHTGPASRLRMGDRRRGRSTLRAVRRPDAHGGQAMTLLRRLALLLTALVSALALLPGLGVYAHRPKPHPSPSPTPTATPTPSPTPTPTVPSGGCALPRYPTPACTGVPAGTVLTTLTLNVDRDSYAVTQPGAVLDAVRIPGNLLLWADNITVLRSQIDGNVINEYGGTYHPYTISDSTIGRPDRCITAPGLGYARYTARRVQVIGHDDGYRVDGPGDVDIRDSYAKLCWNPPELAPPDGSHSGGLQADCTVQACANIVFDHNTIDNSIVVNGIRPGNSGFTMQSFAGNPVIGPVEASDNLLLGGLYSIWTWWSTGTSPWLIHDNRVVDGSWYYGPVSTKDCAHQDWAGNTLVTLAGWSPTATYAGDYTITSTVGPLTCVQ